MRKVILIFPDTYSLADYLLRYQIERAEVNSWEQTLSAELTETQIAIAQTEYGAELKRRFSFDAFPNGQEDILCIAGLLFCLS